MTARSRRLLVVEDNDDLRDNMVEILGLAGIEVVAARNGADALGALRGGPVFDAIVLDLMMPVMDGWEFRVEQKRDPAIATIPVAVLTANDQAQAAAIDADLFLTKPVDLDALIHDVEGLFAENDRRRSAASIAHTERLAAIGTLAAGIVHELNNPLTVILSGLTFAIERLGERPLDPEMAEVLEALRESLSGAESARRVTADVLRFAHAEETLDQVDLREVLQSSVQLLARRLNKVSQPKFNLQETPLVLGNHALLGQVFLNLLVNAAHAVDPERGIIEISAGTLGDGSAFVRVADNGHGVPESLRGRIFEAFFTTKRPGEGTGLGLSISHRIVTSLGGRIELDSRPGRGATFTVVLPALPMSAEPPIKPA